MVKGKYPCGKCKKSTGNSKAVQCKNCSFWFHLRCTTLTAKEFNKLDKSNVQWSCSTCMTKIDEKDICSSINDLDCSDDESDINTSNQEILREQLENVNYILSTLDKDLSEAREEIKNLRNQKINLETIVLKKEEEIINLREELEKYKNNKKETDSSFITVSHKRSRHQISLPLFSTPINSNISRAKHSTLKTTQEKLFSSVVLGKSKQLPTPIPTPCAQHRPTIQNSFVCNNPYQVLRPVDNEEEDKSNECQNEEQEENKLLICADSHGRDLAWYLRQKLRNSNKNSKKFTPVGFVNPGGRTDRVLNERNIKEELTQNQDVLVIICGTNDVSKNEADKALSGIKTTLDQVRDKRVVLVDIPNRYDLLEWSCINVEIRKTNTALKIMSKDYSNVIFVESSSAERHLHTAHGMHFNLNGKRWLAERICEALDVGDSQPASVATPAGNDQLTTTVANHHQSSQKTSGS
ncbi:hypothetical protein J6590_087731 [Homalodisca vitripennis]|nr:hypothetical protein J6590_087731 [Homalodisca vitripennis]